MLDGGKERMASSIGPFAAAPQDYAPVPAAISHNTFSAPGVQFIPGGVAPQTLKPPTGGQQNVPRRSLIDPSKVRRNFPAAATVAKPVFLGLPSSPPPVKELPKPVPNERPRPALVSFDRPVVTDDFPYRTCQVEQRLDDLEYEVEKRKMELAETRKFCERLRNEFARNVKMRERLAEIEAEVKAIEADGALSEEGKRCMAGSAVFRERAGLIANEYEIEWAMKSVLDGITSVKELNRTLRERIERDAADDARDVIEKLERDLQVVVTEMQKKKQTLKDMDAQMIATASRIRELRNRKTEESRSSTEGSSYVSESEVREDSPSKQGSPSKGRPGKKKVVKKVVRKGVKKNKQDSET